MRNYFARQCPAERIKEKRHGTSPHVAPPPNRPAHRADTQQRASLLDLLTPRFRITEAPPLADATEQILRQERTTCGIRIACVTHRAGIRDKVTAFQAGADNDIVKPLAPQTFPFRLVLLPRTRTA